ncbi:MAG: carbohydrate kinase, partial [Alistipes sp.]|nr:carbohydrate kinase [Alistipes sp.]
TPKADPLSRVNTFVHVNHTPATPRYGILLCINGTGILNSWMRRNVMQQTMDYAQMNDLAQQAPVGSDGVLVLPFGNGAERVLENRMTGTEIVGVDLNRHSTAHLLRAAQEGIAYSFRYGIDLMRELGLKPDVIRAGKANLFLSPLFRQTLSTLTGARIELFNTDGSLGAARGAALGAGLYADREEAFRSLRCLEVVEPKAEDAEALEASYQAWKREVELRLK